MQEIKKRRIVIASVLKPVDDTRMFEKLAVSLAETKKFEIDIFGYPSKSNSPSSEIYFHPSKHFKRISFTRLIQPLIILRNILKLKPDSIIITTHELLFVAFIFKVLTRCAVYYDVQENYYRNIRYTNAFSLILRAMLAAYVRAKEHIFSPAIDTFILAENGYSYELSFINQKYIVLENKYIKPKNPPLKKDKSDNLIRLIFSGTLAEETGVFEAIGLAKSLHGLNTSYRLTIIGYCSKAAVLQDIQHEIKDAAFIHLIGGNELVPHHEVIIEIQKSDIGILAYPIKKTNENRVPTKLFEYLGNGIGLLLPDHKPWLERCPKSAYLPVDFTNPDLTRINKFCQEAIALTPPDDVFWEKEKLTLTNLFQSK